MVQQAAGKRDAPTKSSPPAPTEEDVVGATTEMETPISNIMKYTILGMVCIAAFSIRLFAVVRWESVSSREVGVLVPSATAALLHCHEHVIKRLI